MLKSMIESGDVEVWGKRDTGEGVEGDQARV